MNTSYYDLQRLPIETHNIWYFRVQTQKELNECVTILRNKENSRINLATYVGQIEYITEDDKLLLIFVQGNGWKLRYDMQIEAESLINQLNDTEIYMKQQQISICGLNGLCFMDQGQIIYTLCTNYDADNNVETIREHWPYFDNEEYLTHHLDPILLQQTLKSNTFSALDLNNFKKQDSDTLEQIKKKHQMAALQMMVNSDELYRNMPDYYQQILQWSIAFHDVTKVDIVDPIHPHTSAAKIIQTFCENRLIYNLKQHEELLGFAVNCEDEECNQPLEFILQMNNQGLIIKNSPLDIITKLIAVHHISTIQHIYTITEYSTKFYTIFTQQFCQLLHILQDNDACSRKCDSQNNVDCIKNYKNEHRVQCRKQRFKENAQIVKELVYIEQQFPENLNGFTFQKVIMNNKYSFSCLYQQNNEKRTMKFYIDEHYMKNEIQIILEIIKQQFNYNLYTPQIYEINEKYRYIEMQYCELSIEQYVQQNVFNRQTIITLMIELMECIYFLHDAVGIVHRDINPNNIRISNGRVKLINFEVSAQYMKNNERVQLEKQINNMETLGYISLNAHNEQYITSKKDDFESAGYIMLYLLNYLQLPWGNIHKQCLAAKELFMKSESNSYAYLRKYLLLCQHLQFDDAAVDFNQLLQIIIAVQYQ